MSITFDPNTGQFNYRGRVVGQQTYSDGRSRVTLNIEYEAGDDWMDPIVAFAFQLALMERGPRPTALFTVNTSTDYTEVNVTAVRFLTEKIVSANGHTWEFHKGRRGPMAIRVSRT